MYLSMDEIGFENTEKIKTILSESDRWRFIYDVADNYGFEGIHFTPSLYKTFHLELKNIPDYFKNFRLTLHFGGMYTITSKDAYEKFTADFNECFVIAASNKMHDISIHPPFINKLSMKEKEISSEYLCRFLNHSLRTVTQSGITLSLESHVSGNYFQFNGLDEYVKFLDLHPNLGVLIDLSHNYYDGYSEDEIIQLLGGRNITGFHISDARHGVNFDESELRERTHLPVGDGVVNYQKLLNAFCASPSQFGVLEIKSKNEGIVRSLKNLKEIVDC